MKQLQIFHQPVLAQEVLMQVCIQETGLSGRQEQKMMISHTL